MDKKEDILKQISALEDKMLNLDKMAKLQERESLKNIQEALNEMQMEVVQNEKND